MVKVLFFRFQQCLVPFTMLLVKGCFKREFVDIFLIMGFGVRNFGNTSAMRVIFVLKMFKT